MGTIYDSYNNGNTNYLGVAGGSYEYFNVGLGRDDFYGSSNESVTVSGGLNDAPYGNQFYFTGTNNYVYLTGTQTYLWLSEFSPGDGVQDIVGNSTSNEIIASNYMASSTTLNFSGTTLSNITEIIGNSYGDTFEGSGQPNILFQGGTGNDLFYENGPDLINGGGGFNTYYASGS